MCGICGYISKNRITEDELRAMNDTMIHRGPDDNGVVIYAGTEGYTVGLAQRRLSIQDLSPLGHQPMESKDGRISLVFNGEIYNFLELKKELSDYPFVSTCDTEVILAGYLKWGKDFVNHIHGMFAIALYDRESGELILARDRIGKKPLYYWLDGGNIVFGSELKPIIYCPGFVPRIRKSILSRYLFQQYINAPESIFEDVWQLEPGSVLYFKNGAVTKRKYWDIKETYTLASAELEESYDEAKQELKKRLRKAVADRMIADVPLGTFLSGGYDSSLITAMAQENSSSPVKTFTIGFDQPEYNEAGYAKEIARYLGTEHTEAYISEKEMFDLVESIPGYYDEPFADDSQIPTMLVCALAKEKVTVALSGDGGDEFFCGYNIYEKLAKAQQLDGLGAVANAIGKIPLGKGTLMDKMPFSVRAIAGNRNPETKAQLASENYIKFAHAFLTGVEDGDFRASNSLFLSCKYPTESRYKVDDWVVRRMLLDMDTYLPGDILVKMDRASMKYSLENRCPIMDTSVMEYSFKIPQKFKYMNGDKKHILKDIAYDYIPKELLERPKKGFSVPIDAWLRGPLKEKLQTFSQEDYLKNQRIFNPAYVSEFVRNYLATGDGGHGSGANYSRLVWSFFNFQQWYERYL